MSILRNEAIDKYSKGEKHLYCFEVTGTKSYVGKGSRTYKNVQLYATCRNQAVEKAKLKGLCKVGCVEILGMAKKSLEDRYLRRFNSLLEPLYFSKSDVEAFILQDVEKTTDFLELTKEEFLQSYSYLDEADYNYNEALYKIHKATILADLMRKAENILLEETNGRPTGLAVTSENIKTAISSQYQTLNKQELQDFEDLCEAMAC